MARKFKRLHRVIDSRKEHLLQKQKTFRASRDSRRKNKILNKAKQFVTNLSSCVLSASQILLLAKGQKFVPLGRLNKPNLMNDIQDLGRKMRIKCLFQDDTQKSLHPFWQKAVNYIPPMANNSIENFIHALLVESSDLKHNRNQYNLNADDNRAVHELTGNTDIILRPADKGSNIVILSREQYEKECHRQLVGSIHYEEIQAPHTNEIYQEVQKIVCDMHSNGSLDKQTFAYLYRPSFNPSVARFYLLPKIHKIKGHISDLDPMIPSVNQSLQVPGRPIIAQCNGPTERIGKYLDYFLVPIVKKDPIYLLDSKELLHILEHSQFPADVLIITYDVTSMYTNMPHGELLASTKRALEANIYMEYGIKAPPVSDFMKLLEILLKKTEFSYSDKYFRQTIGASMGATPSPEICDIRMLELLREILPKFRHRDRILLNKKYRDDGIILFHGTVAEAKELFNIANLAHPLLKFEFELSDSHCTFLDLNIYKGPRFTETGHLDTKTHTKETECFAYLLRTSAHPPTCFRGFIKGELGRYRRNASDEATFNGKALSFKEKLLERKYTEVEIDTCLADMKYTNRKIEPRMPNQCIGRPAPPLVLSTAYHPRLWALKRIIRKYWPIVLRNPKNRKIFPNPPMIAYRRGRNLSELLGMRK